MPKRFSAMLMGALCALLSVVGMAPVAAAGLPATNTAWTWQNPAPSGDQLGAIAYRVGAEAWCVGLGRGLYKTTDEGSSWSVTRTGPTLGFYDIAFGSATHGAAVGESSSAWDFTGHTLMWRTSDGGTTWKPAAVSGTVMPLGALDYGDATHAWAVGREVACVDGGRR